MRHLSYRLRRPTHAFLALVILAAAIAPALFGGGQASAGQVQTRSIKMSGSSNGATAQTYTATFNVATTYAATLKGMVLDFCTTSPLIDDTTCTAPTSFNAGTTGSVAGTTGGAWTVGFTSLFSGGGVAAVDSTGASITTGSTITWTLTNVTNPSPAGGCSTVTACTFYARLTTWSTTAGATGYTHGAAGYTDYGGFALSTASAINLTARIMETLSFCVYTSSCGDSTAVTLGTGTPQVIDSNAVYTAPIKFTVSTNALSGALVNLYGNTLMSGANSLTAAGTVSAITAGSGKFGLQIGSITTSSGTLAATTNYAGSGSNYGFVVGNTNVAGGDTIANTAGAPVNAGVATITYGVSAATTTPAGIYTATHQLIATGTF